MGNKESSPGPDSASLRNDSEAGKSKRKYNENTVVDPIAIQVADSLKGLEEFHPIVKHKEILGGMLRRRSLKEDAVDGLDYETILSLWQAINKHTKVQTKSLKDEQQVLKDVSKATFDKAEKAAAEVFFAARTLTDQCRILHECRPLTGEVEKVCDALKICIDRCNFMNELLPDEHKLERLSVTEALTVKLKK